MHHLLKKYSAELEIAGGTNTEDHAARFAADNKVAVDSPEAKTAGTMAGLKETSLPLKAFARGRRDDWKYRVTDNRMGAWMLNHYRRLIGQRPAHVLAKTRIENDPKAELWYANQRVAADALGLRLPIHTRAVINGVDFGHLHVNHFNLARLRDPRCRDIVLMANQDQLEHAVKFGVPKARLLVIGYPVRPEFEEVRRLEKDVLRKQVKDKFAIPDGKIVVPIVSGGGKWNPDVAGRLRELATTSDDRAANIHVIVVTGGSQDVVDEVNAVVQAHALAPLDGEPSGQAVRMPSGLTVKVLETKLNAREMAEVLRVADLAAIKAGGGAIGETYAVKTPVLIYDRLSGIEGRNVRHVRNSGTGIVALKKKDFVDAVLNFQPGHAGEYMLRQEELTVDGAAEKIADTLYRLATGKDPKPAEPVAPTAQAA